MDADSDNQKREKKLIDYDCLILTASWLLQHNYFDLSPGAWTEAGITFLNYWS